MSIAIQSIRRNNGGTWMGGAGSMWALTGGTVVLVSTGRGSMGAPLAIDFFGVILLIRLTITESCCSYPLQERRLSGNDFRLSNQKRLRSWELNCDHYDPWKRSWPIEAARFEPPPRTRWTRN